MKSIVAIALLLVAGCAAVPSKSAGERKLYASVSNERVSLTLYHSPCRDDIVLGMMGLQLREGV